jgi:hypothetical protein
MNMQQVEIDIMQARLAAPFPYADIEWRIARSGIRNGKPYALVLAYVTGRAVEQRLDDVCGIGGWRNERPRPGPAGGIIQGISILIDGEWLTKWDGADNTAFEAVKGGLSDSLKRASRMWGIGRYLHDLPTEFAVCFSERGKGQFHADFTEKNRDGTKEIIKGSWNPPRMPDWALPDNAVEHFLDVVSRGDAYEYYLMTRELDDVSMQALFNRFPRGQITKRKEECRALERAGAEKFAVIESAFKEAIENEDAAYAAQLRMEISGREAKLIAKRLTSDEIKFLHDAVKAAVGETGNEK